MKAIDKAWELNLVEDKYGAKEDLIESMCPSEYGLETGYEKNCSIGNSNCNCDKCWNEEIIEEETEDDTVTTFDLPQHKNITNEDRFNTLRQSPISGICLNNMDVEQLKHYLKANHEDGIIYIQQNEETCLQYDDIPKLKEWLDKVYEFTTDLKAEIDKEDKYTNFYLAREHMHKGGKCEYEGKIYYINNGVMYLESDNLDDMDRVAYLSLEDIDSEEWLLLDNK